MEDTASLWMDGRIFRVEKRTRGLTALKQRLAEDLFLFSNLRRNIPHPRQFEIYRTFVGAKFWKRMKANQFVEIPPSMIDSVFSKKLVWFQSLRRNCPKSDRFSIIVKTMTKLPNCNACLIFDINNYIFLLIHFCQDLQILYFAHLTYFVFNAISFNAEQYLDLYHLIYIKMFIYRQTT